MSRFGISRNVLVACAVLLTAQLGRSAQDLALVARIADHPEGVDSVGWSLAVITVLTILPILVIARLSNYLRPSSFLTVAAGLSLVSTLGALLPLSIAPIGLLYACSDVALALAMVASLVIVVQEITASQGYLLGVWAAATPVGDAIVTIAPTFVPIDLWSLVVCAVLVLTLAAFLASLVGPAIEPVSTFEQFDLPGAALWIIGIAGVTYIVATRASSPSALAAGAVGAISLVALVVWTRQLRGPGFVPPSLVSRRGHVIGLIGVIALGICVALADLGTLSVHWTAANGGATNTPLLALWIAAAVFAPVTGRLLDRGAKWVVPVCGVIELIAGLAIFKALTQAATDYTLSQGVLGQWTLVPGLMLFGAGLGTTTVWFLYVAFQGVSRSMLATAAGLIVTAVYSGRVLGGFIEKVVSGEAEGLGEQVRAAAVPVVFAILGLGALIVVPMITKRWDAQQAAQDLEDVRENEQESDPH
ncbi:hypothetical protein FZI91_04020 [Mycobacterium sp. CBMA271]|uniref:hypothetical protein n=1 Tax=unclassified Mycobacteroides TaxID=2618759 RepID=UPI0012DE6EBA|nr:MULTISPECIES: hypothetical protein [unclassified Mycobacteroides]MUM18286.1 hypothetical protein [Mycobacteroides sp. CBMA 326]MUM20873.1 hypothetical protein [Mycobacteroides sp. CBMA 271]